MHCKLKSLNITYHICENNVRYVCFFHVEHSFCFVIFIATQRNIPHYIWKMLTQRNGTKTRQRSRPSAIFRAMKIFFVFSNCFSESKLLLELMVFPTVHVSFPFVASLSLLSFIFLLVFFFLTGSIWNDYMSSSVQLAWASYLITFVLSVY